MKLLHFIYRMYIDFEPPVHKHQFTVKCRPVTNQRQIISDLHSEVEPKQSLAEGTDSFGNYCVFGYADQPHQRFSVYVEGLAKTGMSPYETAAPAHQLGLYRYQSALTRPGPALKAYAAGFHFERQESHFAKAVTIMERIYSDFQYKSGSTLVTTTAEEAFLQGTGVCQDYAHIMISLCRYFCIPARYVVGMLLGEGMSHAWVEICDGGMWIGMDPTNHMLVDDQHIKISCGRDYNDCLINQGLFYGNSIQKQSISVLVEEVENVDRKE